MKRCWKTHTLRELPANNLILCGQVQKNLSDGIGWQWLEACGCGGHRRTWMIFLLLWLRSVWVKSEIFGDDAEWCWWWWQTRQVRWIKKAIKEITKIVHFIHYLRAFLCELFVGKFYTLPCLLVCVNTKSLLCNITFRFTMPSMWHCNPVFFFASFLSLLSKPYDYEFRVVWS